MKSIASTLFSAVTENKTKNVKKIKITPESKKCDSKEKK